MPTKVKLGASCHSKEKKIYVESESEASESKSDINSDSKFDDESSDF